MSKWCQKTLTTDPDGVMLDMFDAHAWEFADKPRGDKLANCKNHPFGLRFLKRVNGRFDAEKRVFPQLAEWGVKHHGILCEKGSADEYVDDKAKKPADEHGGDS